MDRELPGRSTTALTIALALCLAAVCALYLRRAFDRQLVEFAEGPILTVAERIERQPISAHWTDEAPYTLSAYGPGYFDCVVLAKKFWLGSTDLVLGRMVALLALLATAGMIGVSVRRRTGSTEQALLGAVAYVVSPALIYWAPALRVDTLVAFFSCAAYLVVGPERKSLLVSAALVAVGSLVKPTAALTAVPIFLYLLLNQRRQDARLYAVAVCVLGSLAWWITNHSSDGYFWIVAVRNNVSRMLVTNGLRSLGSLLLAPFSWLCLAIIAQQVKERGMATAARSLFCLSFIVSLLISTVLVCREGSHINYFLETCALGSVLIGLFAIPPDAPATNHRRRLAISFFFVAIVVPSLIVLLVWPGAFVRQTAADQLAVKQVLEEAPSDCQVLADGEWVPSVLDAGRLPLVNDPYMLRVLAERKLLSMEPIIELLDSGRVCYLILDRPIDDHRHPEPGRWPAEVLDAMERSFVPIVQRDGLWIYRHEKPARR